LHVGPEQHPVVQVDAQPLHVPFVHVSAPGHVWHCVPPLPHAPTLLPVWHVPLEQQPSGHETPSHWHEPFKHRCPMAHAAPAPHLHAPSVHESAESLGQAAHVCPGAAHAARESAMHVRPLQHPLGHDVASQAHTPAEQCSPAGHGDAVPHSQTPADVQVSEVTSQFTHVDPAVPHVESARWLHVEPSQQPPGHDVASHTHCSPAQR
jgi:hypothetical protein